jgi:hypothetical protein
MPGCYQTLLDPSSLIPHAPNGWFKHLRAFLVRSNVSIELPSPLLHLLQLLHRGDVNLAKVFSTLGWKPSKSKLLSHRDPGKVLRRGRLPHHPHGLARLSPTIYQYPSLATPGKACLLGHLETSPHTTVPPRYSFDLPTLHLRSHLGRWSDTHSQHRWWPCYQIDTHLFIKCPRGYLGYAAIPGGCHPSRLFNATTFPTNAMASNSM